MPSPATHVFSAQPDTAPSIERATPVPPLPTPIVSSPKTLGEQEIEMIRTALDAANGNISEASKRLGISRNTIYRKLRWNQAPAE
jgi:transcriptional regulator of acetoin/glycerol metabolism